MTLLPGRRYPELINDDEKLLENSPRGARRAAGRRAGGAFGEGRKPGVKRSNLGAPSGSVPYPRTRTPPCPITFEKGPVWNSWTMAGIRGTITASRSRLLMFPVEMSSSLPGNECRTWESTKSASLVTTTLFSRSASSMTCWSVVRFLSAVIQSVNCVASSGGEPASNSPWQLSVHQELHGPTGTSRRVCARRAANARAASRSSRSRSS